MVVDGGTFTIAFSPDSCGIFGAQTENPPPVKQQIAETLGAAFHYYPYAQKYVYYCPHAEDTFSLKATLTVSDFSAATLGRGESGTVHLDEQVLIDRLHLLRDGLPANE
jgi:hypothetical protein